MKDYHQKYLKYKKKYNSLKMLIGGAKEYTFTDTGDYEKTQN